MFHSSFSRINQTFHSSALNVARVEKCLDVQDLDDFYLASCCNTTMYASQARCQVDASTLASRGNQSICPSGVSNEHYLPPSDYIDTPSCAFDDWASAHRDHSAASADLGKVGIQGNT